MTPARAGSGFHAPSHSTRRPKSSSAPGWSRGQNLITATVLDLLPTSPAAQHPQESPGGRPALLSQSRSHHKRRLQRHAGADQRSKSLAGRVSAIVGRVICCTHFPRQTSLIRASRHLQPQTASARFAPFATANCDNHDPLLSTGTVSCGLVHAIIIANDDSHKDWRGSRVKKEFRAW